MRCQLIYLRQLSGWQHGPHRRRSRGKIAAPSLSDRSEEGALQRFGRAHGQVWAEHVEDAAIDARGGKQPVGKAKSHPPHSEIAAVQFAASRTSTTVEKYTSPMMAGVEQNERDLGKAVNFQAQPTRLCSEAHGRSASQGLGQSRILMPKCSTSRILSSSLVKGTKAETIEGEATGHGIHDERPQRLAETVTDWLGSENWETRLHYKPCE